MTTPERIAAALALADAADAWYGPTEGAPDPGWADDSKTNFLALQAYRATAPKPLRTRAEVDAEIVVRCRAHFAEGNQDCGTGGNFRFNEAIADLMAEPTTPEPSREPQSSGIGVTIHDTGSAFGEITMVQIKRAIQLLHASVQVDCSGVGKYTLEYLRNNGIDAQPLAKLPR